MLLNGKAWRRTLMVMAALALPVVAFAEPASLATPTAMARATKKVAPDFPVAARQLNISGDQEVSITVNEQGEVVDAKVLKGNAMFSANSLNAVKQWKFMPLVADGQAKSFTSVIVFHYAK